MASKSNVTFNVVLVSLALLFANILRLGLPLDVGVKRFLGYHSDSFLNFTEISGQNGFTSEEHTVITEDGYMLTIFRMRSRKCSRYKRPPVILMHGLLLSADSWLDAGPKAGLAYLIADACYDLWIGNQRGNYYGRQHVRLDPDIDHEFWNFSVDDIGFYDIPATIDYVLKSTGEEKLNYIGYSQGSGTLFIMCSERPGYCDKVNILIGLAPAARQTYTKSAPFRLVAQTTNKLERDFASLGYYEMLDKGSLSQEFVSFFCKFRAISDLICGSFESIIDGTHPGSISNETVQRLFDHFPAGTSVHNMARYGQSMQSDKFQKFDYGREKNILIYGDKDPPKFNLTAVNIPFVVLYGKNDYFVDVKDVLWLIKRLPKVLEAVEVPDPLWNHFDVAYSQYTKTMIFPKVNQYLLKYSVS